MNESVSEFRQIEEGRSASRARPWLRAASSERLVTLVRRGCRDAFEVLYDRHSGELLAFCRSILHSTHDAEDALQSTFAAAYRSLAADGRELAVRPWLFTIARNTCLSIMRQRRRTLAPIAEQAMHAADPLESIVREEEVRRLLEDLRELPERQRSALVLAELHGLSHREIASVLAVETAQVKSYVFQARATLTAEREARGADCVEIRRQLDDARGSALLRGRLRRHLRSCGACRDYASALALRRRRGLGAWAPVASALAARGRTLWSWLWGRPSSPGGSGGCAGASTSVAAGAEVAGGGVGLAIGKLATGLAIFGVGAGAGVGAVSTRVEAGIGASTVSSRPVASRSVALVAARQHVTSVPSASRGGTVTSIGDSQGSRGVGAAGSQAPASPPHGQPSGSLLEGAASAGGRSRGTDAGSAESVPATVATASSEAGEASDGKQHGAQTPGLAGAERGKSDEAPGHAPEASEKPGNGPRSTGAPGNGAGNAQPGQGGAEHAPAPAGAEGSSKRAAQAEDATTGRSTVSTEHPTGQSNESNEHGDTGGHRH